MLGRNDMFVADVPAAYAEKLVKDGRARRLDDRSIRLIHNLEMEEGKPFRSARLITISSYGGTPMTVRETLGQHCGCVVVKPKGEIWADPNCIECGGTGVTTVSGRAVAFRRIDPRDKKLFRMSVTDCLPK